VLARPRPPVNVFSPGFTLCIDNTGGLRVFLESTVSPETLPRFYGIKIPGYEELLKLFNEKYGLVRPGLSVNSTSTTLISYYPTYLVSSIPSRILGVSASRYHGILC
jgi:hypothetical protein